MVEPSMQVPRDGAAVRGKGNGAGREPEPIDASELIDAPEPIDATRRTGEEQKPDRRSLLRRAVDGVADRVDTAGFNRALLREAAGLARHPVSALGAVSRYAAGVAVAAGAAGARAFGGNVEGPIPMPAKDRRFADRTWNENAFFFALLQLHLLRERLAQDLVDAAGIDEISARKARLASQLAVDATAPINFFLTNPFAIKRMFETGGLSVLRGARNLLDDWRLRRGWPRQVDASSFQVGRNLAATPGKVVYRNDLMELIQYAPQTPTTFAVPLLCSPPWINKYYIMDLAPGRSFVEWAVKRGHTTFAISYRNPDASMRDVSLDDYLVRGLAQAVRVVREITGAPKINLAALCLGGTLAGAFTAWLAQGREDSVNSLTLTNTLLDFAEPGILGAFTDEKTIATLDRMMQRTGFLEAERMAATFNLIRANDLIFNYVSNSWLAGEEPPAFDLLAWNADSTRMPAKMHAAYLRSCYLENRLSRGEMVLGGRKLRLSDVKQDAFVLAAVDDHIAPWRTQFKSTRLLGGKTKFVLSNSGHIAGIVNPPSKSTVHWVNDRLPDDPDQWLSGATRRSETWWEEWTRWIATRAGERGAPPSMGSTEHPPLADAPGEYVHAK
jgi:polyhydroxyalkanoate synthase subunit PhaC